MGNAYQFRFSKESRNRLAAYPLLPGGTSDIGYVLDFGLNCLATMNFCQAVRHYSPSIGHFVGLKSIKIGGMKKSGLCGVLTHRLAALCLPPGDGEARYCLRFQVVKNEEEPWRRLSARVCAPGDRTSARGPCTAWRLAAGCALPGSVCEIRGLGARWRLVVGRRCYAMSGRYVVDGSHVLDYGRVAHPFCFVYGDDRVIRYTGADVDTGDAEDAQATKEFIYAQLENAMSEGVHSRKDGYACPGPSEEFE
ncbi:hypothetical protein DEO72_LG3g575 [Vigna unguiculata]|uniref:Uncharacterized protein n=1 Tax=Vigna unguiculata TaxID=3917 RepID=A0A4D6LCM7_VIGUN|nr:hypothetical protein DEO72_LG3g575 [Vigna unguiculata]